MPTLRADRSATVRDNKIPRRAERSPLATWHAGRYFVRGACVFLKFRNLDANRDFHALPRSANYCYQL